MRVTLTGYVVVCDQTRTFVPGCLFHDKTQATVACDALNAAPQEAGFTYYVVVLFGEMNLKG